MKCLAVGLIEFGHLVDQIKDHRALHKARMQNHEELLRVQFPAGAPKEMAMLGRYLALEESVTYEQSWINWADSALELLEHR